MKWARKTVLVTGAAGFIGSHIVKKLLSEGSYVIALDNLLYGKREKIPNDVNEFVLGDVCDRNTLNRLPSVDYLFHFASPSSVVLFNKAPERCFYNTVLGFLNVLEWAKNRGVKTLLYASSGSVYGNTSLPQSEAQIPQPVNLYGIAKYLCEKLAQEYSNRVPIICLRIFAGYGPGEEHKGEFSSVVSLFLRNILAGEPVTVYGDGSQKRDFVYIDDIIAAAISAVEREIYDEIINVGSGKSYSFVELAELIGKMTGKEVKFKYIPKPINYLENTLADVKKLKLLLGIEPKDLKEGLRKYLCEYNLSFE